MITIWPGFESIAPRPVELSIGTRHELTMRNRSMPCVVYVIMDVG
jgi:hypothetical protein